MKLSLLITLCLSFSAFASVPRFDNSKLFVKIKEGSNLPQSSLIKNAKLLFNNNYLISTSSAVELERVLKNSDSVISTEKNYYADGAPLPKKEFTKSNEFYLFNAFNDPKVGRVWAFNNSESNGVSVNRSYLSPLGVEKEVVIVAVVDTGVDYNHEDLKNKMWKNTYEIADNGIDDDNNGYIDDIFGIDLLNKDEQGRASGDPKASHAHGTHVAGTIAAEQNNSVGIAGISETSMIMAIRAVPDSADETDADIVESFLYAAKHGAKLINCSFGKSHNEGGMIVNETITHIGETYGVLTFAAAGNDYGQDIDRRRKFPASFDSEYLVTVASTTKSGRLSMFSNVGKKSVDIAAPGSGIFSTMPRNSYANMSGTSMATPTTVGVAAEVLSHFPTLTPLQLKKVLMDSVTKEARFANQMVSGGRVDLYNSLKFTLENFSNL